MFLLKSRVSKYRINDLCMLKTVLTVNSLGELELREVGFKVTKILEIGAQTNSILFVQLLDASA